MNLALEDLKVYLLCRYALDSGLYSSWHDRLSHGVEVVQQCPTDWQPPDDCGIVVTHEHFRWEEASALRRIYESESVPVLIIADGVLEYRNTWQNPTIPAGSIYQPLLGHKIACIGASSARMIEAWGNRGKTEVIGLPRFDSLLQEQAKEQASDDNEIRILIATATTPAFNDEQRKTVVRSLRALQEGLNTLGNKGDVEGRSIKVNWRLTDGLADELGIDSQPEDDEEQESLHDAIRNCHAVITTPSTIYLESALLNKPTAILDFHNVPLFVAPAWSIAAPEHISPVVRELAAPPTARIDYQNFVLHDHLRCDSPATPRMCQLISKMIQVGFEQRQQNQPVCFNSRLLDSAGNNDNAPNVAANKHHEGSVDRSAGELDRLQAELNQAVHRLGTIPRELAEKNNQIAQLQTALDESRRRVADVRVRLFKLRKILGIGKENQGEQTAETPSES